MTFQVPVYLPLGGTFQGEHVVIGEGSIDDDGYIKIHIPDENIKRQLIAVFEEKNVMGLFFNSLPAKPQVPTVAKKVSSPKHKLVITRDVATCSCGFEMNLNFEDLARQKIEEHVKENKDDIIIYNLANTVI